MTLADVFRLGKAPSRGLLQPVDARTQSSSGGWIEGREEAGFCSIDIMREDAGKNVLQSLPVCSWRLFLELSNY